MKISILGLLLVTIFNSCSLFGQNEPSKQEKEEAFKAAKYDKHIIANFPKYDALAQVLLSNLDTIINYKNKTNYVIKVNGNKESQELQEETYYMFLGGNPYYDIKKIPAFLSLKVDSLWTLVGKPQIEICKEKRPAIISIRINFNERKNNVLECHFLYWKLTNFDNYDSFDLLKDTSLSKECTYRVGITTNHSGW